MKALPASVEACKKTGIFTSVAPPAPFLKEHTTAKGTWGVLTVKVGRLIFCDDESGKEYDLLEGDKMVIAPEQKHHLKLNVYAEFFVEFYREPKAS